MSVDFLQERIRQLKNPCMVGLDPTQDLIPLHILTKAFQNYGETPQALAFAYKTFCVELLDVLKDYVPAVKIQTVCFEMLGAAGITAMADVADYAKELGYYVMFDALRSDAPHIAALSAKMYFGGYKIGSKMIPPFNCDALSVSGYLGSDSIFPYLPYCRQNKKNIFLMLRSSNKSGREVQDLLTGDRTVYTAMADLIIRWSKELYGEYGFSEIGAIVGAYDGRVLAELRDRYDKLFFMVVGYGAQGGTAKPVSEAFDNLGRGAVIASSRGIIGAWKESESDGTDYCDLALEAVKKMKSNISRYVTVR